MDIEDFLKATLTQPEVLKIIRKETDHTYIILWSSTIKLLGLPYFQLALDYLSSIFASMSILIVLDNLGNGTYKWSFTRDLKYVKKVSEN